MSANRRVLLLAQAAVIVAAGWWVLAPSLHGPWIWDDVVNIPENALMRDPSGLWKIWFSPSSIDYYPVFTSVNWIGWRLWGADTTGYHMLNAPVQVLDGLLLWRVFRSLGLRWAWLGGLIFVVHPMMVESGAWIAELKNTISLFFLLLSFLAYLEWEKGRRLYLASLVLFLLAMLTKASVVMFPVVLLLHAWWKNGRVARAVAVASVPFFAISAVLGVVTVVLQGSRAIGTAVIPVGGFLSRAALAGLGASFYLWKFAVPTGLLPLYPRWAINPPSPAQLLPWLGFGALAWFLAKHRWRGALFGLGVYAVNLAPVAGFITISHMRLTWVMDHLAYLPLLGVIGAAVGGLGSWTSPGRPAWRVRAAGIAAAAAIAALAAAGHRRAATFASEDAFWENAAAGNPGSSAARYNLGLVRARERRFAEAAGDFGEAARLDPSSVEAETNLANALSQSGRFAEAIPHYGRSLELDPGNPYTHYNLALALREQGREDEARAQLLEAARLAREGPRPGPGAGARP